VTAAGGIPELVALAERLGATVFAEGTSSHGRLPMPVDHPLYAGILPLWEPDIHAKLLPFDVLLAVGVNVFRLYIYHEPANPLPATTTLLHLDNDPWQIGKNASVEVGMVGDPRAGLAELVELLPESSQASERIRQRAATRSGEGQALRDAIARERDARPMTPLAMMDALARVLPPDVAVVEEAITTHQNVFERLGALRDPAGFFAHRGWALGWGIGAAMGVKFAWPDRPVLALVGDGAAMYGIQGLWTAAHHNLGVTFVIANNSQYKILKVCGDVMSLPGLADPRCPGLDLNRPAVDFVGLARSLGVEEERVEDPETLSDRV
jgi:benzoylformate decarboxylase